MEKIETNWKLRFWKVSAICFKIQERWPITPLMLLPTSCYSHFFLEAKGSNPKMWHSLFFRKQDEIQQRIFLFRNKCEYPQLVTQYDSHFLIDFSAGLCTDQHPLCSSYALNGLCDWPGPFQDMRNIHKTCAFSCGYCKKLVNLREFTFTNKLWINSPPQM